MATVGVDVTMDGRPEFFYTGVDTTNDGIPDALEEDPAVQSSQIPDVINELLRARSVDSRPIGGGQGVNAPIMNVGGTNLMLSQKQGIPHVREVQLPQAGIAREVPQTGVVREMPIQAAPAPVVAYSAPTPVPVEYTAVRGDPWVTSAPVTYAVPSVEAVPYGAPVVEAPTPGAVPAVVTAYAMPRVEIAPTTYGMPTVEALNTQPLTLNPPVGLAIPQPIITQPMGIAREPPQAMGIVREQPRTAAYAPMAPTPGSVPTVASSPMSYPQYEEAAPGQAGAGANKFQAAVHKMTAAALKEYRESHEA